MRIYKSAIAMFSGLGLTTVSTVALAGGCGNYGAPNMNCTPNVVIVNSAPQFDQTTINIRQPMGHLRSVHYNQVPQMSITRIHSQPQSISLADSPTAFTGGCHPSSTGYCRANTGRPINVNMTVPQPAPQPQVFISPPAMTHSSASASASSTYVSNSQPRQYGENTFVPGIAHVPTSYVDRSVENNQAILNSGQTIAQSTTLGGMAPTYQLTHNTQTHAQSYNTHTPSHQAHSQVMPPVQSTYQTPPAADGTYWEQTSGPTMIDGTMVTQVLCKRQLPKRVVNPVIGVPTPVPVSCAGLSMQHAGVPAMAGGPVSGPNTGWTF